MLVKNSFKRSRDEVERATAVLLASVNGENEVRVVMATGVGVSDIVVSALVGSLCSTLPSNNGRFPPFNLLTLRLCRGAVWETLNSVYAAIT